VVIGLLVVDAGLTLLVAAPVAVVLTAYGVVR
jgi:hypothetical protein